MAQRTFLFLSCQDEFLAPAYTVKQEGYPVYLYRKKADSKHCNEIGVGYFSKTEITDDFWEVVNKVSKEELIILIDDNGYGDMADFLREAGYKVIGGSSFADKIEYDRGLGLKIMEKIGLKVPNEKEFSSIKDARRFIQTTKDNERFVFKPHGEDYAGSSMTYTSKGKDDLLLYVDWVDNSITDGKLKIDKFVLQEFVDGVEADFAGYFDGENFISSCLLDIEEKKSGDGNKGEATGCMGNIIINFPKSRYFTDYISKLTPYLRKANYVGEISINNIFAKGAKDYEEGQPYGLEFTPRFGWDAHLTECAIIKNSGRKVSDFYIAIADKKNYSFPKSVGMAVRVYSGSVGAEQHDVKGKLFSYDKSIEKNIWPYAASIKDGSHVIEENPVLVMQTVESTVKSAIKTCYDKFDKLNLSDAYYRNEIGQRAAEVISFLGAHDWL